MKSRFLGCLALLLLSMPSAFGQSAPQQKPPANGGDFSTATNPPEKVPPGVIIVKGAWSSASDSTTPVPEGGQVTNSLFADDYFGLRYPLPGEWFQKYEGPPPSDSGRYVLAQIRPMDPKAPIRGNILVVAQDMFFNPLPGDNTLQLINYMKDNLQADYKVEIPPTPTKVADRPFTFFAYWSPVAELHWYVLATQIRCHAVEIVLSSRDTKLLSDLMLNLNKMTLPEEASPTSGNGGGAFPVCIKDYVTTGNVLAQVAPTFSQARFNAVPVRIIIDKKGKVKHIHFLSAFPDQAKAITDALMQWKFRPYMQGGQPVEVETGIMFGQGSRRGSSAATASVE
jgi:Gram-negative bacterial TonB protein C-terminal